MTHFWTCFIRTTIHYIESFQRNYPPVAILLQRTSAKHNTAERQWLPLNENDKLWTTEIENGGNYSNIMQSEYLINLVTKTNNKLWTTLLFVRQLVRADKKGIIKYLFRIDRSPVDSSKKTQWCEIKFLLCHSVIMEILCGNQTGNMSDTKIVISKLK